MIIEIPDDNSIIKWRYKDNEDWKSAEISDLIKAYERPPFASITIDEEKMKEYVEQAKAEILAEYKIERPKGEWKHEVIGDKSCVLCTQCFLHFDCESNYCPNCGARMGGD